MHGIRTLIDYLMRIWDWLVFLFDSFAYGIDTVYSTIRKPLQWCVDVVRMNKKYARYWFVHRKGVRMAGKVLGVSWWRLLKHDISKLYPDEWVPNARYWGMPKSKQKPEDFAYLKNTVWLKHYARNDHHTAFWLGKTMSDQAIREMIADWWGAGYVHGGKPDVKMWYTKNGSRMKFTEETRSKVEFYVDDIDYVQKYLPHLLYGRGKNGSKTRKSSSNN